jgi:hypothetical protein
MILEVTAGGLTNTVPFSQNAVWIGCDEDVQVPAEMVEGWERGSSKGLANLWLPPLALGNVHLRLREQEAVRVRLLKPTDRQPYVEKTCIVRAVPANVDFQPQEEEMHAP